MQQADQVQRIKNAWTEFKEKMSQIYKKQTVIMSQISDKASKRKIAEIRFKILGK